MHIRSTRNIQGALRSEQKHNARRREWGCGRDVKSLGACFESLEWFEFAVSHSSEEIEHVERKKPNTHDNRSLFHGKFGWFFSKKKHVFDSESFEQAVFLEMRFRPMNTKSGLPYKSHGKPWHNPKQPGERDNPGSTIQPQRKEPRRHGTRS